jgi:hypothetical protein
MSGDMDIAIISTEGGYISRYEHPMPALQLWVCDYSRLVLCPDGSYKVYFELGKVCFTFPDREAAEMCMVMWRAPEIS